MSTERGIISDYTASNEYIVKISADKPLALVLTADVDPGLYCFDSPEDAVDYMSQSSGSSVGNMLKYLKLGVDDFPVIVPTIVSAVNLGADEAATKTNIIKGINDLKKASATLNKASKVGAMITYKPDIITVPDYHVRDIDICNTKITVCDYLGARSFIDLDAELNADAISFRQNFTTDRITPVKCGLGKWNTAINAIDYYDGSAIAAFLRVYIDGSSDTGYAQSISNRILPFSSVKYPVEFIAGKKDETDSLTDNQIMSFISYNGIRSWEYATCTNTIWKDARRVRIFDLAADAVIEGIFDCVDKDMSSLTAAKRALRNFMDNLVGDEVMVDGFKIYLNTKKTTQSRIDEGEFYFMVDCDEMPSPRLIGVTFNKVSASAERIYKLIEEA